MSEGGLDLTLRCSGGRLTRCEVRSERQLHLWQRLEGKPIAKGLELAPLLSSICSTAHGIAAARAVERAGGLSEDETHEAFRAFLLSAEVLQNHLWFWFKTAPELLGDAAQLHELRDARQVLGSAARALGPGWSSAGGGGDLLDRSMLRASLDSLSALLERTQLALPARLEQLPSQAGIVGRLFHAVIDQHLESAGATRRTATPTSEWIDAQLALRDDFSARPTMPEGPAELGLLSVSHPLVDAARASWGPALGARFVARLVDTCASFEVLRDRAQKLRGSSGRRALPADEGSGLGFASTSRGPLFHRVNLEKGQLVRWRVVAPTEWTFQPDGPVSEALEGLTAPDVQTFERRVGWVVASLDPCVECAVHIEGW